MAESQIFREVRRKKSETAVVSGISLISGEEGGSLCMLWSDIGSGHCFFSPPHLDPVST